MQTSRCSADLTACCAGNRLTAWLYPSADTPARVPGFNDEIAYPRATEFLRNDNGGRKVKRPNMGPAAWRLQNRDALNKAHVLFDFFFVPFFFFAMMLLLRF